MSEEIVKCNDTGLKPITPEQNRFLCDLFFDALENETVQEVFIPVDQFIHEGVYSRTCFIPKDACILGAFITIPTTVIVSGDCFVTLGNTIGRLTGYHVVKAEAGRRQAFRAITDTYVTMSFKTSAKTVQEAEKEFTPEWQLLTTNRSLLNK